jgi:PIN domain nuclease of toxin-antitoxin system
MRSFRSIAKRRRAKVNRIVLDASSLLAVLLEEPGADVVARGMAGSAMSAVNYSEVLKKAVERGGTLEAAASVVRGLQLEIVPFAETQASDAARLYPGTKNLGLSFADRACLALAIELKGALYTADSRLAESDTPIRVVLIRPAVKPAVKKK